jgi:hypothetical protein
VSELTFALTIVTSGNGSGSVSAFPSRPAYFDGTMVTLTPSAATGSTFAGWSGACTGVGACVVAMSAARTVTATFALNSYSFIVTKNGTGTGGVGASPPGPTYLYGTMVTVVATPAPGSTFTGWGGDCTGTANCIITIDGNKAATATFTLLPVSRYNGVYTGTYSGTGTLILPSGNLTGPVNGPVKFTVVNGAVTVTAPGLGTGTIDAAGASSFSGSLATEDCIVSFTGSAVVSPLGALSAGGAWTCIASDINASGTWSTVGAPLPLGDSSDLTNAERQTDDPPSSALAAATIRSAAATTARPTASVGIGM